MKSQTQAIVEAQREKFNTWLPDDILDNMAHFLNWTDATRACRVSRQLSRF